MAVAEEAIGAANMIEIASGTRAVDDEHAVGLHDIAQQTAVAWVALAAVLVVAVRRGRFLTLEGLAADLRGVAVVRMLAVVAWAVEKLSIRDVPARAGTAEEMTKAIDTLAVGRGDDHAFGVAGDGLGCGEERRKPVIVVIEKSDQRTADLTQIVRAAHAISCIPSSRERGHQDSDEQHDDRNHHQKFDEREASRTPVRGLRKNPVRPTTPARR